MFRTRNKTGNASVSAELCVQARDRIKLQELSAAVVGVSAVVVVSLLSVDLTCCIFMPSLQREVKQLEVERSLGMVLNERSRSTQRHMPSKSSGQSAPSPESALTTMKADIAQVKCKRPLTRYPLRY